MSVIDEAKRLAGRTVPVLIGCALGAGTIALLNGTQTPANADVTKSAPREAFKSGGERAEEAIRDVIVILKQMDRRLERMETAFTKDLPPLKKK